MPTSLCRRATLIVARESEGKIRQRIPHKKSVPLKRGPKKLSDAEFLPPLVLRVTRDACLWTGFPDIQPLTEFCLHETLGRPHLLTQLGQQEGRKNRIRSEEKQSWKGHTHITGLVAQCEIPPHIAQYPFEIVSQRGVSHPFA